MRGHDFEVKAGFSEAEMTGLPTDTRQFCRHCIICEDSILMHHQAFVRLTNGSNRYLKCQLGKTEGCESLVDWFENWCHNCGPRDLGFHLSTKGSCNFGPNKSKSQGILKSTRSAAAKG